MPDTGNGLDSLGTVVYERLAQAFNEHWSNLTDKPRHLSRREAFNHFVREHYAARIAEASKQPLSHRIGELETVRREVDGLHAITPPERSLVGTLAFGLLALFTGGIGAAVLGEALGVAGGVTQRDVKSIGTSLDFAISATDATVPASEFERPGATNLAKGALSGHFAAVSVKGGRRTEPDPAPDDRSPTQPKL